MSSSSSTIFTGSSAYSTDFQNVITRAVNIASLPISLLNNQKTALDGQNTELSTIANKFSSLQTALQTVQQSMSGSYSATSGDTAVVTATASTGAVESDYSIKVTDTGAYSTMMTDTWNTAPGQVHPYQLYIGSTEYDIQSSDNTAASVAAGINSAYGAQVHATVVNVGSNSSPDYRISLQGAKLSSAALDLKDNGTSLADVQTNGHPAQYEIDNSGNTVHSDSRTVNVATGVTLTIAGKSDTAVDVRVTRASGGLGSALSNFATAYNAVVSELDGQRGSATAALEGQSVVRQLSTILSGIATRTGSGGLSGLNALGLDLGADGRLTFNSSELAATSTSNPDGLTAFLGSISGGGFLKAANDALKSVTDAKTGLLPTTEANLQSQITRIAGQIEDKQTQVDNLQTRLQKQMAAADAAIASMQQQYSYMANMFQAMQNAEQAYK